MAGPLKPTRRTFLYAGACGIGGFALAGTEGRALQSSAAWNRPGGLVPPGEWWAGGGPRLAPSSGVIVGQDEPGQRLILSGTVYGGDGRTALAGVTVYVYQTDLQGLYNREGRFGAPHRIKGWANTEAQGRFEFTTIRPGHYPNRSSPAHIHMTVCRRDIPEWWLPETRFQGDPLLTAADGDAAVRDGRFSSVQGLLERDGYWRCTRDVRL
jgi:protocatechuate 3,4-dioxygenase beta subunit